ncbi:MAG TPA: hypothetical protein VG125_28435 [Pirellulales bacterium]|nr:hypothetical protein [Pirellulales bacterium]
MLWLMAAVGAFFGTIVRACLAREPYALFLLIAWETFFAGCIGARWSRAHALLAAFLAFFFLWPLSVIMAASLGLID